MQWKLLGLVPIVRAEGPDISRSSVGRFGAEAIWLPTSLLPRFGVAWTADDDSHVTARFRVDDVELALHLSLDDGARVRSVQLDRWADPESSGAFAWHPFGIEVHSYATFDGVSIPNRGRGGWFFGTDRWPEGDFFHYEITDLSLREPRGAGAMSVMTTERRSERRSELDTKVSQILSRHPAVGLAVGIIRNGELQSFHGHGLADIASHTPITEDTVIRIGSLTKSFTAVAVMQLWEQGLS